MKDISKFLVYGSLFLIPFLTLYVENDFFFPYITGKNFGFRILVEVAFASWVVLAFYEPQYRPRFSWIAGSFATFLVVIFFADYFGANRLQSFWNNFERMEGYVTLIHTFMYFLVMGSVFATDKIWNRYFYTKIFCASVLSLYVFAQIGGLAASRYEGFRADGTLGNASYMSVYMLFMVFVTLLLIMRSKSRNATIILPILTLVFMFMLLQTATRGTALGLFIGLGITTMYIALFSHGKSTLRTTAISGLVTLAVVIVGFIGIKDTAFVQNNATLQRLASISLSEGSVRFDIWKMAFEGVKERPLLGWGQSNYNYVFNKYYKPELHGREAWFDRVHNIVMDWLIAGGVLGLITYFSILFSAIYYLFLRPVIRKGDESFTVVERGILIGLLAGYTVHNMFVFDNIVSYIFYGTILAYIHARVAKQIPALEQRRVDIRITEQIVAPVMAVTLVLTVYFVNVPGIRAAGDIINAFRTQNPEEMLVQFELALSRNSFADQEIREQMTQRIRGIIESREASPELKQRAFKRVEEELLKQTVEKPGDARVHVFVGTFYRLTNNIDPAIEQFAIARSLSPRKQLIIFEQGYSYLQKQDFAKSTEMFKEAFDLGPQFMESRVLYAMSALYNGQLGLVNELIQTPEQKKAFALNDSATQAAHAMKMYPLLTEMLNIRIEVNPDDAQSRASLAYVLDEQGNTAGAIEVLIKAKEDIPSFKEQAEGFIRGLEEKMKQKIPALAN